MFVEIDQIAVPRKLMERLRAMDEAAVDELRAMLLDLTLYSHALTGVGSETHEVVTLRDVDTNMPGLRLSVKVGFDG